MTNASHIAAEPFEIEEQAYMQFFEVPLLLQRIGNASGPTGKLVIP